MFRITKHQGIDYFIVGKVYDNVIEYDDEILGRIAEELYDGDFNLFRKKLYHPYFINEIDKPEFEIYKFKKELKNG